MSSSGLIYAVIVGAWAAYLVPMWLRRQDELNEARPTERFSTAIRLLSGRAGMERRYAKAAGNSEGDDGERDGHGDRSADSGKPAYAGEDRAHSRKSAHSSPAADVVDVRALAVPVKPPKPPKPKPQPKPAPSPSPKRAAPAPPDRKSRRAQVLARRRRTTSVLFLAFTAGTIVAAVCGVAFLWAPGVPGTLLTLYIAHLRRQERRRFEVKLDRRRAAEAAKRLREQRAAERPPPPPAPSPPSPREEAQAVVEETDHAEWVDGLQRPAAADQDGWDPIPVPLPTYVTAPVAPRATDGRTPSGPHPEPSPAPAENEAGQRSRGLARRARERGRTPLFDQHNQGERPRAANE